MKKFILIILLVVLPLLASSVAAETTMQAQAFLPLTMGGAGQATQPTPTALSLAALQAETIRLINEERAREGCPAATPNMTLMTAAQEWSEYMVRTNTFEHSPNNWYPNHGYAPDAGENVATGHRTPTLVVADWMNDLGHKKTVLFCTHAAQGATYDIGIGFNEYRWTMALGERLP